LVKKILISELIGKNAITYKQSELLYNALMNNMRKSEKSIINFKDVSVVTSSFFNGSVCLLLKDYTIEEVKIMISFEDLSEDSRNVINISIANAIEFYEKKEKKT